MVEPELNLEKMKNIQIPTEECLFCKIVLGEVPSEKVFENDDFLAFKDINPKSKGHTLIIPKKHIKDFLELGSSLYKGYLEVAKKVAEKLVKENNAQGFNLVINNGLAAGQIVFHLHMHIIPRYANFPSKN